MSLLELLFVQISTENIKKLLFILYIETYSNTTMNPTNNIFHICAIVYDSHPFLCFFYVATYTALVPTLSTFSIVPLKHPPLCQYIYFRLPYFQCLAF